MRKTVGILCMLVILVTAPVFSQTKETRAAIEQMSVLISEGKKDKADKLFNDIRAAGIDAVLPPAHECKE